MFWCVLVDVVGFGGCDVGVVDGVKGIVDWMIVVEWGVFFFVVVGGIVVGDG